MPYEFETMVTCPPQMFNFGRTYVVIVSGARYNPIRTYHPQHRWPGGVYFQVAGCHIPKSSAEVGELAFREVDVAGVVHNCETLVEEIVMAGGGPKLHHGSFSLPIKATTSAGRGRVGSIHVWRTYANWRAYGFR